MANLKIPIHLWFLLIRKLRQRGRYGKRESGAFLLGKKDSDKVTMFVLYDDLDPACLDHGIVVFKGHGFVPLWNLCEVRGMSVKADIHTHGSKIARQSYADASHPMISKKGHVALILPNFAQNSFLNFKGIAIYEYLGGTSWKSYNDKHKEKVQWTLI